MTAPKRNDEHPLANILINVLVPVMILSLFSKDPQLQALLGKAVRPWHLGPVKAIIIALALPIGYGVWYFVKNRKANFFSGLGLLSVVLTGGLTLYLWNPDGSVKPEAGLLFGIKEALIPLVLGVAILFSQRTATPLIRVFLYNDSIFDIPRIEARVAELAVHSGYAQLLAAASRLFAASFFVSAGMNVALARWFFRGFDARAVDALEVYNSIIAKITGWGFAVIGVPILVFLFFTLMRLLAGLRRITELTDKEMLHPR
ncbi:MAG: hypothetical protein DVB26_04500 [Verrucomicrobia bacterium]|nr:MAG: hypothetical protein DVB26_04500 [Verrucomicrobiota bacterium]